MPRLRAIAPLGLLLFVACRLSPVRDQAEYQVCKSYPERRQEGTTRSGFASVMHRKLTPTREHQDAFRVSITRKDCLDSVTVEGFPALGPFLPVDDESFEVNYPAKRLAYVAHESETKAVVWIDGKTYGPYRKIVHGPRFSKKGRHVAFVVENDQGEELLVVDGRSSRSSGVTKRVLQVHEDGRIAREMALPDGRVALAFGDMVTSPLQQICSFEATDNGHWSYAAKTAAGWVVVLDGRPVQKDGRFSCELAFSQDGQHFAYLVSPDFQRLSQGVVVDGQYETLERPTSRLHFVNDLAIVTLNRPSDELLVIAGRPTPRAAPTVDGYQPQQSKMARRVRMGDSVGPLFDDIEAKSIRIDDEGRLHYRASRLGAWIDVVDNQIPGAGKLEVAH